MAGKLTRRSPNVIDSPTGNHASSRRYGGNLVVKVVPDTTPNRMICSAPRMTHGRLMARCRAQRAGVGSAAVQFNWLCGSVPSWDLT